MFCELSFSVLVMSASIHDKACSNFEQVQPKLASLEVVPLPRKQIHTVAISASAREKDMAVRTLYGEAGDEPRIGQIAVAYVIRNRTMYPADIYGGKVEGVIKKPYAFEPWLHEHTRAYMQRLPRNSIVYRDLSVIVERVFSGELADPTHGATHFLSPAGQIKLAKTDNRKIWPDWARGKPLAKIGGHHFFKPKVEMASLR